MAIRGEADATHETREYLGGMFGGDLKIERLADRPERLA